MNRRKEFSLLLPNLGAIAIEKFQDVYKRQFGYSAAHKVIPVPLLPSGPGGVRGAWLHRARSSTHRRFAISDLIEKRNPQRESNTAIPGEEDSCARMDSY